MIKGIELSYSQERRGKMAAINRAMEFVRGDIVIFSDANNMYESQTLKALVAPFGDKKVGAVSGAKIILKGDGILVIPKVPTGSMSFGLKSKRHGWVLRLEFRERSGRYVMICFERPPDAIINDDFYMAMRILKKGYCMVYVPDARSMERVSLSAQDEMTCRTRIVAGRYQAISLATNIVPLIGH